MRQHKFSTKKIAFTGILLSLALIISFVEAMIPPIIPVMPYVKIGFANIVLLILLLLFGYRICIAVVVIKCVLVGVFSGNPFSIVYSLPAGVVAYTITALMMRCEKFSIPAISAVSSMMHNFVQIIVASIVIGKTIWYMLPYLLLLGGVAGIGIGIITFVLLKFLPMPFLDKD